MGVGYQKFQAGSPDGYLDFGVISTPGSEYSTTHCILYISVTMSQKWTTFATSQIIRSTY